MLTAALDVRKTGKLRLAAGLAALALLQLAALGILLTTEDGLVPKLAFGLTWILLNFLWVIVVRRPALA